MDKLFKLLTDFAKENEYNLVFPKDEESEIDFININVKTNTIYFGDLGIDKELTD